MPIFGLVRALATLPLAYGEEALKRGDVDNVAGAVVVHVLRGLGFVVDGGGAVKDDR